MSFCTKQPAIEDADQHLRDVKRDLDALTRSVFGERLGTSISLCSDGKWMAYVQESGPRYENLALTVHANLYDALYLLEQAILAKRDAIENARRILDATLGIDEPIMQEAAE